MAQEQIQLKAGDVISKLDGNAIDNAAELERYIRDTSVESLEGGGRSASRTVYLNEVEAQGVPRPISTPSLAGPGRGSPRRSPRFSSSVDVRAGQVSGREKIDSRSHIPNCKYLNPWPARPLP